MRELQVSERKRMFISHQFVNQSFLVISSTFIVQASNSAGIQNFFTIEGKVGDFYMSSRKRGVTDGNLRA